MSRLFTILVAVVVALSPLAAVAHTTGCPCPNRDAMTRTATAVSPAALIGSDKPCCGHGKACAAICAPTSFAIAPVPASTGVAWIARQADKHEPFAAQSPPSMTRDAEIRPPRSIA